MERGVGIGLEIVDLEVRYVLVQFVSSPLDKQTVITI